MKNEFFIYVKLIKLDPATGKAFAPPCELQTSAVFSLGNYIHEFQREESDNSEAYASAITEILTNLHFAFGNCPLGWFIGMESTDEFLAEDNPFYKPETRFSEEFFFSPVHNKVEINTEFMWQWAVEAVQGRFVN